LVPQGPPPTGAGDWPEGLVSHTGAEHLDGNGLSVFEVWEGAPEPTRVEWMLLKGSHVR